MRNILHAEDQKSKELYKRCMSFWQIGFNYLSLTEAVFQQTIKTDNPWVIVSDVHDIIDYHSETLFSDFNIIIPSLFNLYHGMELLLKGFLLLKDELSPNHKIENLLQKFKQLYPDETMITDLLERYISHKNTIEPIHQFFITNKITANKFFDALKYPEDKKTTVIYDHMKLKYRANEGMPFFIETVNNIECLKRATVALANKLKETL